MEVTRKQKAVVEFVASYRRLHSIPPTMDEIAEALAVNKKTVYEHLQGLKRRGVVTWRRYEARSLKLLVEPEPAARAAGRGRLPRRRSWDTSPRGGR